MSHCSLLALALATLMVVASDAISQPSTPPELFDVRFWGFREGASPSSVAVGEECVYVAAKDTIHEYPLREPGVLGASRSLGLPSKVARLLRPNRRILIAVLETGFALIDIGAGRFSVRQSSGEKFGAISAYGDLAFFARYDTASRYTVISSADLTSTGIIPLTRRAYQSGEVSDLLQSAGFLLSGCMSFDIRVYRVISLAGDSLTSMGEWLPDEACDFALADSLIIGVPWRPGLDNALHTYPILYTGQVDGLVEVPLGDTNRIHDIAISGHNIIVRVEQDRPLSARSRVSLFVGRIGDRSQFEFSSIPWPSWKEETCFSLGYARGSLWLDDSTAASLTDYGCRVLRRSRDGSFAEWSSLPTATGALAVSRSGDTALMLTNTDLWCFRIDPRGAVDTLWRWPVDAMMFLPLGPGRVLIGSSTWRIALTGDTGVVYVGPAFPIPYAVSPQNIAYSEGRIAAASDGQQLLVADVSDTSLSNVRHIAFDATTVAWRHDTLFAGGRNGEMRWWSIGDTVIAEIASVRTTRDDIESIAFSGEAFVIVASTSETLLYPCPLPGVQCPHVVLPAAWIAAVEKRIVYLDQVDGGFRRYTITPDGTATPTHLIGMNPFVHLATYDSLVLVANGRQGFKILAATGTAGVVTASNGKRAFVAPNIISDGRLTVRCDEANIASVSLIDGLGRCAWTIRGAEVHRLVHVYDIRFLPQGLYYVGIVTTSGRAFLERLLIQ